MSRWLRILVLCALAIGIAGQGSTRAQDLAQPVAHSPGEEEALELLTDGMAVSARSRAERVLRDDPDSIVGHYVLGRVLFEAEGSLARAMFHLGRARELYETTEMRIGAGSPFHQELLYTSARLAGQMELYDYQLEILGYHDHLYDPDLVAEHCWPLMKLGRSDEARQFAQIAVTSPNPWQRSAGLNAMCALEGEARTRGPYHRACLGALEDARRDAAVARPEDEEQAGIAVDAYNAALAATADLRFADAEQYALDGVRRFEPTGASPWQLLVELRLSMGRTSDALDAFGSMIAWNDRQPAALRDQGRAETEAIVAMIMLVAGETPRALERIDRALARPDRRGLTTDGADQARGRHALLRRIIRRTLEEERAEEAAWTGRIAQLGELAGSVPRRLSRWPDDERVAAVLADSDRLVDSVRPYMAGGISGLSPWLTGELVEVVGPAIVAVALADARALDQGVTAAEPAYLALDLEIAAARGDSGRVLEIATAALPRLQEPGWALVRARCAALAARAAEDEGNDVRAAELYAMALETDPGVLRRLGIALPVSFSSAGGEAEEAADLLSRSPRFADRGGLFEIAVDAPGTDRLRACLRTATGNEIRCVEVRRPEEEPEPEPPAEGEEETEEAEEEPELTFPQLLARETHRQLFSARIELSRVDLTSLDGRPLGGSAMAQERLRELVSE